MHDFNFVRADVNPNIKYTYRRDNYTAFSWPDHILTLWQYMNVIDDIACPESVDNLSDHLPLSFSMTIAHHSQSILYCPADSHSIKSCAVIYLDIIAVKQGMYHKANHMLTIFRPCDPYTKTKLMQSFCLSLYGASLWMASSPELRSLETAYNNLLRKIWNRCHTDILHRVARVSSIYNMMLQKAGCFSRRAGSHLLSNVLTKTTTLVYTNVGYNSFYAKSALEKL